MDTLAITGKTIEGIGVVVAAVVFFMGSIYMLLTAVFGWRMAYFVAATGLFGFMVILSAVWAFGAQLFGVGTPAYLGPKGELAHWVAVGEGNDLRSPTYPVIARYPGDPWQEASEAGQGSEVEPATLAFQEFLAEEANQELRQGGLEGEVTPETFEVTDLRFTKDGDVPLAAGIARPSTGGSEVQVFGFKDPGNEPLPSFIALGLSVVGFVIHLPFLDRLERKRKEIITGGEQAPWRGPA